MVMTGHTGNVGAPDWPLDNPPDPGMPSSPPGANTVSHALVVAIEHCRVNAAVLLRGTAASLPMSQCAPRQAATNGHTDATIPHCVSFYDPMFMGAVTGWSSAPVQWTTSARSSLRASALSRACPRVRGAGHSPQSTPKGVMRSCGSTKYFPNNWPTHSPHLPFVVFI
jgi:hypothetical protein